MCILLKSILHTAHLKLDAIWIFSDVEGAEWIQNNRLDETFHTMVKIPGRGVSVLPDKFVGSGAGGQELPDRHPIDENFFLACWVFILNLLILQKTGKILVISIRKFI